MHKLKLMRCYLAGPIDELADAGVKWRNTIKPFLHSLGVGVLDPCDKPCDFGQEEPEFCKLLHEWKEEGYYNEVSNRMQPIVAIDLRMVDISDFILLHIDKDVHLCGSYHEGFLANLEKKPVIIHCPQGKSKVPNWMFGLLKHEMFFDNWEDVKAYLNDVNNGDDTRHFNRWRFFDFNKIYGIES